MPIVNKLDWKKYESITKYICETFGRLYWPQGQMGGMVTSNYSFVINARI